ncbi:MAG: trigger factor [Dehalococcoidia bacterium]|nr:trigger factor [Dehalococcoidia bacterium]
MKVSAEPMENSQVALNVEMEAPEVDKYLEKAYNRLVGKVSVPGFRKGKTPRAILERHIGKDALLQEALELLVPEVYEEALESQEIDAIAQPQIELVQTEPVIFKAIVPLRPTVKLGDYGKISIESKPVEIKDEEVEATIEQLRQQHAVLLPVDRPVQFGDTVTIGVRSEKQGQSSPIGKDLVYEVTKGGRLPLPGFPEELEGMKKGEERSFELSYPSDYEMKELAGHEHSFKVTATEVKEKELPEINDEFAKSLGSEDLASLREQIATNLKTRAEDRARLELEQKAVDAAVELSEMEYPPVLVDREIDRLLNEEARNFPEGIAGLENYLKSLDKTMDDHREELRPIADRLVVRSLVLEKITEAEKSEVGTPEIDEEIDKMVKHAGEKAEELRNLFGLPQARESIKQSLITRKTVDRLVQIASGSV